MKFGIYVHIYICQDVIEIFTLGTYRFDMFILGEFCIGYKSYIVHPFYMYYSESFKNLILKEVH